MAEGIISRKGSSFSTNGITRSVHVRRGNSVALGEPVELAIAPSITTNSSVISASTGNTQVIYKTITLDDTRTLILYTANSPSGPLSAVVQTLNKSTQSVSVGTAFLISLSNIGSDYVRNFDAILMNDGRVLLAMSGANVTSGPTGRRRIAAILTITGTVVTLTGQSILDTTNTANTGTQLGSLAVINDNQFLYLHAGLITGGLSSRPTATVLTVSGNTITSNEQFILDSNSTSTGINVVKIDENRFLATYSNSSNFPVVLILVFTAPDIITMGTAYIPHNQSLSKASNKVIVTSPNRAFIAFPSSSSYLAARYSFSGASMTLITTLTLPYSYTSTGDYVINSQSIKLMMSKNDTLNIFYWTSQSQSSTGYINHSCYDSRFNNVFNSNHMAFSTSSSYNYGFDVNELTNNYFLITTSQGTSSTFTIVTGTLSNASWVVYPVATFTSVRGITLQAQTSTELVDVIFPQTTNGNPFIPI
jgi:hypothetical protein